MEFDFLQVHFYNGYENAASFVESSDLEGQSASWRVEKSWSQIKAKDKDEFQDPAVVHLANRDALIEGLIIGLPVRFK
jgi:hypothetical protein